MAAVKFYRPEEGVRARGGLHAALAALFFYGVYELYHWLDGGWWSEPVPVIGKSLGNELPIDPRFFLCTVLGLAFTVGIYLLYNYKRWADFLIETEAEVKKVHWAPGRQVVNESLVVVSTVMILTVYIFGIDLGVTTVQRRVPNWVKPSSDEKRPTTWNDLWDSMLGEKK